MDPSLATADVASYIGAIMASFVAAWLGLDKLKQRRANGHEEPPGNGNEHIRGQVYKVLRSEKILDQESHDRQCTARQALVMQHIDTHTHALEKISGKVDELLRLVKNGG